MPLKFISYKTAPIDRHYGMMRLTYLSRVCKQTDLKMGSGETSVAREPEQVPLELKWTPSACSGMLTLSSG